MASGAALAALVLLVASLAWSYQSAAAQGNGAGTLPLNTTADFGVCVVLPGVIPQPGLTNTIVSSANGGEIRLRATVEDYFDGASIDETQWITGAAQIGIPEYAVLRPEVANGSVSMAGSYLRSQVGFSETTPVRFFEASAQFASSLNPNDSDIGFYRANPPLQVTQPDPDALRLFIAQRANNTSQPDVDRMMYVRSRDGDNATQYLYDTAVDNWGGDETAQRTNLAAQHTYRIEWDSTSTWYLIDGSPVITYVAPIVPTSNGGGIGGFVNVPLPHTGVSTRSTYVFLYAQNPASFGYSPLQVDWVRAGVYPATGDFVSCAQDAGQVVNWVQATITATVPTSAGVQFATRTSVDGATWSPWANAAGSVISGTATLTPASPSGRYLQYRLTLTSSDPLNSPEVGALTFSHFGPASLVVAPVATTLDPGASQQFTATVRDLNNTVIADAPITWTANSGGAIGGSGLFTAGLPAGVFTDTVLATASNNVTATASVIVRDLPPIADAGGPYTGQEGQPVALDASASADPNGGPLTFAWDLDNDGQFDDATGATPSASWGDEGIYTIGVRATDSSSLTDTATTTVTIVNVAPQLIAVTNNGPVRRTQPVTVTVDASDVAADALTYAFDWTSDGAFDVTGVTPSAATTFAATGAYTTTVRVTDPDGGIVTGTTTITVTPQVLAIAVVTNDGPVRRAQPATVIVTATQELTDTLTYAFDWNNDSTFETGPQPSNTSSMAFAFSGVYTVGVKVVDSDDGVITGFTLVAVTPQTLQITSVANSTPVVRGQPVTVVFTVTQQLSDPLTYSFDWNNDGVYEIVDQASNSAVTLYTATGAKVVGLRARDLSGGVVTGTTTLIVAPQSLQVNGAVNSGPVRRNQPATVTVSAVQQLSDPLTYSFDWNNDGVYDVVDQASNSAAFAYPNTGDKVVGVRVRDANGGAAVGATTIVVKPQQLIIAAVANSGPALRDQPVTVAVTAQQELSDALLYSFDWNNDGLYDVIDQASSSAVTTFATSGAKAISVRVRDADGGEATDGATVIVNAQVIQIVAVTSNAPQRRGQPVTVTVTAQQQLSDPLTYSFDWDNDGVYDVVDQPGASAAMTYGVIGEKRIRVRVRDAQGSETSQEATLQITPQALTAPATNSGPVRRGQAVLVTVNATQELSDVLRYSFDWNNDGIYEIEHQAANAATTTFVATGDKVVGVRVVDADGGVATNTTTVVVMPQSVTIAAVTDSGSVQVGETVQVTVAAQQELSDVLLYSFDWDSNGVYDVVDLPANSATTVYTEEGLKPVTVRVRDSDGGIATGATTISVTAVTGEGAVELFMPFMSR